MTNEEIQKISLKSPASMSIKGVFKGMEVIVNFTELDVDMTKFVIKAENGVNMMLERDWQPLPTRGGYTKKEQEFVEGKVCPKCKGRLVIKKKKDGSPFHQCENKKWDKFKNMNTGTCDYTDWLNDTKDVIKKVTQEDFDVPIPDHE